MSINGLNHLDSVRLRNTDTKKKSFIVYFQHVFFKAEVACQKQNKNNPVVYSHIVIINGKKDQINIFKNAYKL